VYISSTLRMRQHVARVHLRQLMLVINDRWMQIHYAWRRGIEARHGTFRCIHRSNASHGGHDGALYASIVVVYDPDKISVSKSGKVVRGSPVHSTEWAGGGCDGMIDSLRSGQWSRDSLTPPATAVMPRSHRPTRRHKTVLSRRVGPCELNRRIRVHVFVAQHLTIANLRFYDQFLHVFALKM